jgi:hypothetical protein
MSCHFGALRAPQQSFPALGIERNRLQAYLRLMPNGDVLHVCIRRSAMSKFGILRATALSLALAAATPAFAAGFRDVGAMHIGNSGFGGTQATVGSPVSAGSDASYCRQRWAYYDAESGKYMGDDGEWRSCR